MADNKYANDINEIMRRIDTKDYEYFLTLDEDLLSKIVPLLIMRWQASLPYDGFKRQGDNLVNINNNVNCGLWGNGKDKRLFLLSLCALANGKYRKHGYFGRKKPKAAASDNKKEIVRQFRSDLTDSEFDMLYNSLSKDEMAQYLEIGKLIADGK